MSADKKPKLNLGRGLSTLLGDFGTGNLDPSQPRSEQAVPIELIRPNPSQPRAKFDEDELKELAVSVREKGIIQPLILRPDPKNSKGYMIVAGERRWRAAQQVQLHEVPAIIRDLSDRECLEIGVIENIQRSDLNPLEEAQAYRQLMEKFDYTQEKLSSVMGKSRSFIANRLRLLNLPDDVKDYVRSGQLSAAHARTLAAAADPSTLAAKVVNLDLSVRQTELLTRKSHDKSTTENSQPQGHRKDIHTRQMEASLSAALATRVTINLSRKGGEFSSAGRLIVDFKDLEQLQEINDLMRRAGTHRGQLS